MQTQATARSDGNTAQARASQANVSFVDPLAREARECFQQQATAIAELGSRLEDGAFGRAVHTLYGVEGHVVITGMGKSGLIGKKIAATLASTGTPSFFVHAADAAHGDLGMVTERDAVLLISYSGETSEVVGLLPHLHARGIPTLALVGRTDSSLGRGVDAALDVSVDQEICPHNLAPTNSTLAALAMGDALAVSLMRLRGFHPEDFARLHPGGSLGRRLTGRVRNTMISKPLPVVSPQDTLMDCVLALARAQLPVVLVVDDEQQRLCGIVSEADLRVKADEQCMQTPAERLMKTPVPVIDQDAPLHEAELRFERDEVEALVALDGDGHISGVLTRNQEG